MRLGSTSIESGIARMCIQKKSRRLLDIPSPIDCPFEILLGQSLIDPTGYFLEARSALCFE